MKQNHPSLEMWSAVRSAFRLVVILIALVTVQLLAEFSANATVNLPIRNRMQWLENDGYCGETSIQEVALYYGTYISQYDVRKIFDPTQQQDLAELENWEKVADTIKLKISPFPFDSYPTPQYKAFSGWMKGQLAKGYPVALATWLATNPNDVKYGGTNSTLGLESVGLADATPVNLPYPYPVDPGPLAQIDHFITATGYVGADDAKYNPADLALITNHALSTYTWAHRFGLLFDTRANSGNSRDYVITLPQTYCFGLSFTGNVDGTRDNRPVRIELDRIDEPNLIKGETPVDYQANLTITNLRKGARYVLYRYNTPASIPLKNYAGSKFTSKVDFRATASTQTLSASIPSNSFAAFRCVPLGK